MSSLSDWEMSPAVQPKPEDYAYDLDGALAASVGLRAIVPADAFTAETLGTERAGNGVLIRDGVVLTIGYLITEAETIWLHLSRRPRGARPRARLRSGDRLRPGAGAGAGRAAGAADRPVEAPRRSASAWWSAAPADASTRWRRASSPSRNSPAIGNTCSTRRSSPRPRIPYWGGTAMIGPAGELLGIGSLQLQQARENGPAEHLNMIVPIDLLKPILDELLTMGRRNARRGHGSAFTRPRWRTRSWWRACRPAGRRAVPTCAPSYGSRAACLRVGRR